MLKLCYRPGTEVGTAGVMLYQVVEILPLESFQSGKETFLEPTFP